MLSTPMSSRIHPEHGFTMIEIVVVIALMGIVSAIACPAMINLSKHPADVMVKADAENASLYANPGKWNYKLPSSWKQQTLFFPKQNDAMMVPDPSHNGHWCIEVWNKQDLDQRWYWDSWTGDVERGHCPVY